MSGRTFTPEFKRECAELVLDHGYTTQQACKATDVGPTAIPLLGQATAGRA